MKLIFICGCLEPGRDGVGDYSRRLAGELIRNGHQVLIIASNDKFIEEELEVEQESEGTFISVLRLSATTSSKNRLGLAKERIESFDPEWISLQYVPFSFQKKGLPFGFAEQIKNLGSNRKWHIMFHELWVGMNREASLKYKLWGALQKRIINNTINLLKPTSITTQSRLHQCYLEKMGHKVNLLPLFSNFKTYGKEKRKLNGTLKFLVFGSIHPGAPIQKFANELSNYGKQNNKKIHFIFIGRCPRGIEEWITICKNNKFKIDVLGEQEPEVISKVISKANFGISSTPFYLYEKSGTIAAMMEHKLPVVCVATKYTPIVKLPYYPAEVNNYQPDQLDIESLSISGSINTLETTGRMFTENLSLASLKN